MGVRDLPNSGDDLAVIDGVLDPVAARGLLVLEVELDVDEESLAVAPFLLEHAVEPVEDDPVELDRHADASPLDRRGHGERLHMGRDVVNAEDCCPPVECRHRGTDGRGRAADRRCRIPEHAGEGALAREADENRAPDAADPLEPSDQRQVLVGGLAEAESRVDADVVLGDPRVPRRPRAAPRGSLPPRRRRRRTVARPASCEAPLACA